MNTIFVFLGKGGTGKDTLFRKACKQLPYVSRVLPITTRPPRKYEQNMVDYRFVTNAEFQYMMKQNTLLEYRYYEVSNEDGTKSMWYYGHPYGKNDQYCALIGTPVVCQSLSRNPNLKVIPIYITVNDEERLYRCILREQKQDSPNMRELVRRYFQDNMDFCDTILETTVFRTEQHLVVENQDLEKATSRIVTFINTYIEGEEVYVKRERM